MVLHVEEHPAQTFRTSQCRMASVQWKRLLTEDATDIPLAFHRQIQPKLRACKLQAILVQIPAGPAPVSRDSDPHTSIVRHRASGYGTPPHEHNHGDFVVGDQGYTLAYGFPFHTCTSIVNKIARNVRAKAGSASRARKQVTPEGKAGRQNDPPLVCDVMPHERCPTWLPLDLRHGASRAGRLLRSGLDQLSSAIHATVTCLLSTSPSTSEHPPPPMPLPPPRDRDRDRAPTASAASSRPPSFRSTVTNSSIRRPPPALRTSGLGTRKAKPAVTLVFAAGDAVPSSAPTGLRRTVSGASPSEEALSRQLDQDMAGERLGLRSRRSSVATLASLRTFAADVDNTVQEEEEDDRQPGPSRQRENSDTLRVPSRTVSTSTHSVMSDAEPKPEPPSTPPRKVNPKASGAWLRWNSPTPTFPKKGEKGKGKEVEPGHNNNTDTARFDPPTPTRRPSKPSQTHSGDTHTRTSTLVGEPSPSNAHEDADLNDVSGLLGRNSLNSSTTTNPALSLTSSTASKPPVSTTLAAPAEVSEVTQKENERPTQPDLPNDDPPPQPGPQPQAQPEQPKGWLEYVFGPSRPRAPTPAPAPAPAAKTSNTSRASAPPSTPPRASTPSTPTASSTQTTHVATKNKTKTESLVSTSSRPSVTAAGPAMNGNGNEPNAKRCKLDPEIASLALSTTPTKAPPTVSSTSAAKLMARESPAAASLKASSIRNGRPGNGATQMTQAVPSEPSSKASSAAGSAPHTPVRRSTESAREPNSPADDPDLTPRAEPMHVAELQGWGAYFSSFVFSSTTTTPAKDKEQPERPKNTTGQSKDSDATIVETADPAADQKPLPTEELPGQPNERAPTPPPVHLPAPPQALVQSSTPSPGSKSKLASSTSSTAGWLNYLAFRASQKKITGSTVGSSEPRVSGETAREEVMDFENDPNFPAAESPTKAAAEKALVKKEQKEQPVPAHPAQPTQLQRGARDKNLTHKRSQNLSQAQSLALEARRQSSTSSTRSGVLANERPLAAANKPKSSLPPPPQPPAKQPSLLIPTFETTFDRPPRSFLPRTTAGGVATATGVAWRALGAMSSYVYGEKEDTNKEARGRKAGRDVGADLPRRIGLGSGTPDDGWKNVRRVVVVGVHGWFPAKMLTR